MIYLLWIPFLLFLGVYCYLEKLEKFYPATALKVALSAFVAVVAICEAAELRELPYTLMAVGLAFAVPADFFLQYIRLSAKKYAAGILCFGAMHTCLITAFFMGWGINWYEFALAALFVGVTIFMQKTEKWDTGEQKLRLSLYTVLVVFMSAKAISVFISAPGMATFALGMGGLLFFVSDVFLGVWDYYKREFKYLAANRIIYFCGQFSLAFALLLVDR